MRLIDADALTKEAGKLWSEMPDGVELSKELMKAINHAPTVGGWVSVKDRLPGNEFVLVSVVTKNTGHRWETPTIGEIVHGKWFLETEGTIADNVGVTVTHWMPMPEPPKEVSGDAVLGSVPKA